MEILLTIVIIAVVGMAVMMMRRQEEAYKTQLDLLREQMKTTTETVLKARQEELGARNKEQVGKIVDPLQKSLKDMQEALLLSKEQQKEAMTRLDETIKMNMKQSASLGETADRLTRALTGEVKVQGNFGELKLKQLLEDLELKEGEQFDTQETLRDKAGKGLRGDDGRGMIPDFILHFPNNRHFVVDSKMSLTDYERYMNAEDGTPEKSAYLKAHIESVRAQVKRLAKKEYTKYLPEGYNRLNFAIMYVPIEGALNLALLNDTTLWREAYDQGVMILGPQTMYMNLRVLEMMWTQVRQLKNQQAMIDAANMVIERVQDFGMRFADVEASMNDTIKKINRLKITTAEGGPSIITAAKSLIKAGARENKKKRPLADMDDSLFIESVRAQVKRLAKKEYTKYLPEGYNRLNFAIMYVPIEGALNLALLNDTTLWREAYDQGVMILGPQTMYMNLRVLEMMWTQVRQLKNQQAMIDAANLVIERVQDFGIRFMDVETSMQDTMKKINKLKITTAEGGPSIITAAKSLIKAGARENKKKKTLSEMDESLFIDTQP